MKQVTTSAILYKLIRYSDRSAIALAFSKEMGKFKLFIPKAYSKNGGLMTFVPGMVTFNTKDTSDLNRFVSFNHDPAFYFYTQTPDIMFRMHLVFDFFTNLFELEQGCPVLWNLITKYDESNFRELTLYTIYRLFREAGLMFELCCAGCGAVDVDMNLIGGQLYCLECSSSKGILIKADIGMKLNTFADNLLFKTQQFTKPEELEILNIFAKHIKHIRNKTDILKSFDVFLTVS